MTASRELLGAQIWLEPTDSPERVDGLLRTTAELGLGWARLFLIWPWIEPCPGEWQFDVFDWAFDAAQRYGLRLKPTLTANSGPWHIGTPALLHAHTGFLGSEQREPARRYIRACVSRYAKHPALGQWILWNEPYLGGDRTDESLGHWQAWLAQHYQHDLAHLNRRWRTGYGAFEQIPFPEALLHPQQKEMAHWTSYDVALADWQARAAWLVSELAWIKAVVREIDADTPTCVNPVAALDNQPLYGLDLHAMGSTVEVLGASFHPAWHLLFAERADFPALIGAGVRLVGGLPSVRTTELTEIQMGSALNSGFKPGATQPAELQRFMLAALASGAQSVHGWCVNTRPYDFEAGEWALLDDNDQPSERSEAVRRLAGWLNRAMPETGPWQAAAPRAWVAHDPYSAAVEMIDTRQVPQFPGRMPSDGAHGADLLAAALMGLGVPTTLARLEHLAPAEEALSQTLIVLSHVVAWDAATVERLGTLVEGGATVLLDATSGRKDREGRLHRPWPGGLTDALGLRATGLEVDPNGFAVSLLGQPGGHWLLARLNAQLDPEGQWQAWPELRFARDGQPCIWERPLGRGRVIVVRGLLGPSLVHATQNRPAVEHILRRALPTAPAVSPISGQRGVCVLPVPAANGALWVVLAPEALERGGRPVRLRAAPGQSFVDLWSDTPVSVGPDQECSLPAPDGIAVLWRRAARP